MLCLGLGPDAFIYIGNVGTNVESADSVGIEISDGKTLEKHEGSTLRMVLSNDLSTNNIAWLSVWCRQFKVDFGHIIFPKQSRIKVGSIQTLSHDVTGDIFIMDEKTLQIENFHYDGKTFWPS